jgi:hypothetical protein
VIFFVDHGRDQSDSMGGSCGNRRGDSPVAETATESHRRINSEKEAKKNRGVKVAAKKMIKKKVLKKMTSYFGKKTDCDVVSTRALFVIDAVCCQLVSSP